MKKIIYFSWIAAIFLAAGCHKDSALTTLAPVSFTGGIKASAQTVALSTNTDASTVETFTWPAVTYPVKAHVTYVLQVDLPTDTLGSKAWANATNITIGNDILTKTYTGADFNTMAINAGITPNTTGVLAFRIQAYQDRYTYSRSVAITVSPYKIKPVSNGWAVLYLPGFYQGWSPATAGTVAAEQNGIYEGYIYMPASSDPAAYDFKFTSAADWNHINYGNGATPGTLTTDGTAGDLVLPKAGYYELVANPTNLTWTYTPISSWSIIGDATPGGWTTDTQMTYDPAKQVWTVTANMTTSGSFKFRANNAWKIDFGIDANGKLQYADNPAYPSVTLNNLTVPSSGNYTITLDLHDPNAYNYTLHKN